MRPRMFDGELLVGEDALYIDGIGYIAQYHSWLQQLWEKGIPYFVRDYKFQQLSTLLNEPTIGEQNTKKRKRLVATLTDDVQLLNSKILAWETCRSAADHGQTSQS